MKNRFKVEIYDEVKDNDVTLYSESKIDREHLTELIYSNITSFDGNIRAFVYDTMKQEKTAAAFIPIEITQSIKTKLA